MAWLLNDRVCFTRTIALLRKTTKNLSRYLVDVQRLRRTPYNPTNDVADYHYIDLIALLYIDIYIQLISKTFYNDLICLYGGSRRGSAGESLELLTPGTWVRFPWYMTHHRTVKCVTWPDYHPITNWVFDREVKNQWKNYLYVKLHPAPDLFIYWFFWPEQFEIRV